MTDYFALLEQPRKPWLDPDALKAKYHEMARAGRADPQTNEAYRVLSDPASRLQHLLALEQKATSSQANVPRELVDVFMQLAPLLQANAAVDGNRLNELSARVDELYHAAETELHALPTADHARLAALQARFRYLSKWRDLLREKQFHLSV